MRLVEETDFIDINSWREARKVPIIPRELYAPRGYIVDGVAAGFLTTTDTKACFVENMVTNPKAYKEDREEAVLKILQRLEEDAVKMGYKYLLAVTNHSKIELYAAMIGGKPLDVKLFGKEI
jgi:hypothetical protein